MCIRDRAQELAGHAIGQAISRAGIAAEEIGDVVMGLRCNRARHM